MTLSLDEIIKRADALYNGRERLENVKESVDILRKAGNDYMVLWRLSRAYFFLGQEAEAPEEKLKQHLAGAEAAKKIIRLNLEKGVECYFWLGVNRALLAQIESPVKALFNVIAARHCLKKAIKLDKSFHAAGPLRVLARLDSKLPFIIFDRDRKRVRKLYLEAIEIAPTNTVTRIYFADFLLSLKELNAAKKQYETISQMELDGIWDFEIKRDKKLAEELLKTLRE